jgi:hypothetical protein
MPTRNSNSRTVNYFIELYGTSTLRGAIERAANREIETSLFGDVLNIPIDVDRIARLKHIQVKEGHRDFGCKLARLVPRQGGFLAELKPDLVENRRRATLAHEIGHSLFYRDDGNKPRHQIGIFNEIEHRAEEAICERFAQALLMPSSSLSNAMGSLPSASPATILNLLHNTARKFMVTMPSLASRLSEIEIPCPPYLIVFFRFTENSVTHLDPRLRVVTSHCFGNAQALRMWSNRSVEGVNLRSVGQLFEAWVRSSSPLMKRESGRYIWNTDQKVMRTSSESASQFVETVDISSFDLSTGKWKNESLPMAVSSCLYSRENATDREAQIISVLSPQIAATACVKH